MRGLRKRNEKTPSFVTLSGDTFPLCEGEGFGYAASKQDYKSKLTQRVVKAGASAALLIPQRRRVRREEKIREEAVLRERIFIPLRFSGRAHRAQENLQNPIKSLQAFNGTNPLKVADF